MTLEDTMETTENGGQSTDSSLPEVKEKVPVRIMRKVRMVKRVKLSEHSHLVLYEGAEECKGAPLLSAFSDIGITPILTANHYIDHFKLPLIGGVQTSLITPGAVIKAGQAAACVRVYGNSRMVVVISECKTKEPAIASDIVASVMAIAKELETKQIWCTEGIPVEKYDKIERKEVQFLTTSEEVCTALQALGHKPLNDAVISGITGGIITECVMGDPDISVILAPTSALFPDALSSVFTIQILDNLLGGLGSDTSQLEKGAKELEAKVKDLLEPSTPAGDDWSKMYG